MLPNPTPVICSSTFPATSLHNGEERIPKFWVTGGIRTLKRRGHTGRSPVFRFRYVDDVPDFRRSSRRIQGAGASQDPRHQGKHPELKDKVIYRMCCCSSTLRRWSLPFIDASNSLPCTRETF